MNDSKRRSGRILGLLVFFILCFFASFFLGRYPITPKELIEVVASRILPIEKTWTSAVEHVIFQVRLPRVLLAALIGAGLSCAGAAYQGIFQNPMVSPSVLGASAGAAFGAALGLFFYELRGDYGAGILVRNRCGSSGLSDRKQGSTESDPGTGAGGNDGGLFIFLSGLLLETGGRHQ